MYEKITPQNVIMYNNKKLRQPTQSYNEKEFEDDLKKDLSILKDYLEDIMTRIVLKERLLLNHLIVLNNVFSPGSNNHITSI